jgi:hypothetical protein
MIHIVFNEPDVNVLKKAIELDESLQGDVLQVKDDYAVGPLTGIYEAEGLEARKQWWKEVLAGGDYDGLVEKGQVDDPKMVADLKERLTAEPGEICWVWAAQNKHDVSGYYWLMSQLKDFQGRIYILYLNNLPFISEKGTIFYPDWLHVIPPKEFIKAKRLARPITLSEFEVDPDEWKKIAEDTSLVKMLEGGKKIAGKDESFYDAEILKNLTPEWQKAGRVLTNTLNRMKIKTGDVFLMWRMKQLINNGKIGTTGEVSRSWKDFDVKVAGTVEEK